MGLTIKLHSCVGLFALAVTLATQPAVLQQAVAQNVWGTPDPHQAPAMAAPQVPLDVAEPDWSLLDSDVTSTGKLVPRNSRAAAVADGGTLWTSQNKPDGSAAMSVKQPLLPFWDARVGADLNVARPSGTTTTSDMLRQKFGTDAPLSQSSGTAWVAMTAPGVASIWDQTAIEARVDPAQDLGKFGTSISKSVPLNGNQYSLTLQNGLNVIQQNPIPTIGYNGRPTRTYESDQTAKLSIADTGTSFIAGQTLSTSDDKWLRKVGAEQKLFGGVNITGSISETLQGPASKSLAVGFKHSW